MNAPVRIRSAQQQAVVDFVANGRGSAFIEAVAGAGKTTTLIDALAVTNGSVAFAAYNKKIADEIKAKVAPMGFGNRVRVGTFHSFGLSTWRRVYGDVKIDKDGQKADRTREHLSTIDVPFPKELDSFTFKLISLAKQRALGLIGSIDDPREYWKIIDHFDMTYDLEDEKLASKGVEYAIKGLHYHRDIASEIIDFDDMIYMPVVSGCKVWWNDHLFCDESQDLNDVRRAYARKMIGDRGCAYFVGDRRQSIYAFCGADSDSVDRIIRDFHCTILPMTTTYRCPKSVVTKAREIVSHIEAHPSAPEGKVEYLAYQPLMDAHRKGDLPLGPTDAVLCRKTKPLVEMAFQLLRVGTPCHVEGRDIGAGLIALAKKFKSARSIQAFVDRLEANREQRVQKLIAKGKNSQAESYSDQVDTLMVIVKSCDKVEQIDEKVNKLFADADHERVPSVTLSTVHKSKGREWPRVFVLGYNIWMPGPWARQAWEVEQEHNLIYVAYTRAQETLSLVSVPPER